ncbi:hypothetical protein D3C81_1481700 [compost metagenome]
MNRGWRGWSEVEFFLAESFPVDPIEVDFSFVFPFWRWPAPAPGRCVKAQPLLPLPLVQLDVGDDGGDEDEQEEEQQHDSTWPGG